ncbi:hypothetical protein Btru_040050 [Bulinus truncatus]|nr:hypothetical protein Btru_040050 [Bulinus truncatus]
MAERKAVNKYYPPDWDPRKGSANKRVGQHPLRDRAKKLSQGILVIRFELPYNIWCGGCGSHVGMGVRYNAEKSKVGHYYSTPIFKFRMKCHLCDNYFEIQTDPKNHDYVILCGARRKEQRWDPVANEQVVPEDKATQKKLATDAMFKLEHGSNDQQKGAEKTSSLAVLEESKISMKDDYILNRMARDQFRAEKKQIKEALDADNAILKRNSMDISLVEETEEDKKLATLMKYSVTTSFEEKQKEKRKSIELRPLFSNKTSPGKDLKNKLGKVLEASYKDPFQAIKKSGSKPVKSSFVLVKRSKSGKITPSSIKKEKSQVNKLIQRFGSSDCISATHTEPSETVKSRGLTNDINYNTECVVQDDKPQLQTPEVCNQSTFTNTAHTSKSASHLNDQNCDTGLAADKAKKTTEHLHSERCNESGLISLMSNYANSDSDSASSVN